MMCKTTVNRFIRYFPLLLASCLDLLFFTFKTPKRFNSFAVYKLLYLKAHCIFRVQVDRSKLPSKRHFFERLPFR